MAKKKEKPLNIYDIKECPDCASQNLVYNDERQQVICRDCGLIYEPLAPDMEKKFEVSHGLAHAEATERIMIRVAEEKPRKQKRAARKAGKKAARKAAKKKPGKKAAKKKAARKKPAKKPAKKKRSLFGHLKARFKRKR